MKCTLGKNLIVNAYIILWKEKQRTQPSTINRFTFIDMKKFLLPIIIQSFTQKSNLNLIIVVEGINFKHANRTNIKFCCGKLPRFHICMIWEWHRNYRRSIFARSKCFKLLKVSQRDGQTVSLNVSLHQSSEPSPYCLHWTFGKFGEN